MKMFLGVPGKRTREEYRGGRELERWGAHRLGKEERGPVLPAQRRWSAESQVGHLYFWTPIRLYIKPRLDFSIFSSTGWFPTFTATGTCVIWPGSPDRSSSSSSEWTFMSGAEGSHSAGSVPWADARIRQYPGVSQSIHSSCFSPFCQV